MRVNKMLIVLGVLIFLLGIYLLYVLINPEKF